MKISPSLLLFAALVSTVFAAENSLKPTASTPLPSLPNIVCAMTVCPTASLSKRELACPSICKDNCKIIDDQCCPGIQKAVCNSDSTSHSALPSSATPAPSSAQISSSSASVTASSSSSAGTPTSSQSSSPAVVPSQADSNKAVLSTILLMALISVALLI